LNYRDIVYDLTMEYSRKVIGDDCKKVKVIFSNNLNGIHGRCYPYTRTILYCDGYMKLNRDNIEALKYTIVEECAHLVRLPHDEEFYTLCRKMGCDVSVPPPGMKHYWRYYKKCEKCGNEKFYHHKPRNNLCKKCGGDATIFFGKVME
jgi:hypothetical protein